MDTPLTLEQQLEIAKLKVEIEQETDPRVLRKHVLEIMGLWLAERNVLIGQLQTLINEAKPVVAARSPEPMPGCQVCSACGVRIEIRDGTDDVVHFSHGKPGTRSRLKARVCQYAKKQGCINTDPTKIGTPHPDDAYNPDIDLGSLHPEFADLDHAQD